MVQELRELSKKVASLKRMGALFKFKKDRENSSRVLESLLSSNKWHELLRKAAMNGYTHTNLELKVTEADAKLVVNYFEDAGFLSFIKGKEKDLFQVVVDWKEREYSDECPQKQKQI
jgi:hypothetical protein